MVDETGNPTETAMQLAAAKWDRILTAMIEGFRAYYRIHNTLYDEELGPFSICRPPGVSRVAWDTLVERRFQKQTKLSKRDSRLAQRGLQLFVEHFGDLWD